MGDFDYDEREALAFLKEHDFSQFSTMHKNFLWKKLNSQSEMQILDDDELDAAAGGANNSPDKPDKSQL